MNPENEAALKGKFSEFKKSVSKIGLEETLTQFKTIGQDDWRFELLCELYYIQVNITAGQSEQVNKGIRSNLRLINSEIFLRENGVLAYEVIEFYADLQFQEDSRSPWKYLLKGFVYIPTRCDLVQGLTKNSEFVYKHFIDILIQCANKSLYSIQISEMIFKIIEEHPDHAYLARFKLVEMQILPDLITKLTVIYCRDTVEFLNGVFNGNASWFLAQTATSGQYLIKMKQRIIAEVESFSSDLQKNQVAIACSIRALAGIIGYFGIKLVESEAVLILNLLSRTNTERLVRLFICLMLLSADQFLRKQKESSRVLNQLLQSEISEMPLLVLVYFQTDAIAQVEDTIRTVLAMQVPIARLGLFEMQKLFKSLKTNAI